MGTTQKLPTGQARRVVTGLDASGQSAIVSDAQTTAILTRPGGATITEIWRADTLPARFSDTSPLLAQHLEGPAPAGFVVRICMFPPATAMDADTYRAYVESVNRSYGPRERDHEAPTGLGDAKPVTDATKRTTSAQIPGLHRTDTVDVLTVIAGELCLVTETDETVLRPGDSVVQRGTTHAWHNRTNQATAVVTIMMAAT